MAETHITYASSPPETAQLGLDGHDRQRQQSGQQPASDMMRLP
jgi:hypothetical protein